MDNNLEATLKRMDELQIAFVAKLGEKVKELSRLILLLDAKATAAEEHNQSLFKQIHQLSHNLAGSAGTFKQTSIFTKAKAIETLTHDLLNQNYDFNKQGDCWYKLFVELIASLRNDVQVSGRPSIVENFSSVLEANSSIDEFFENSNNNNNKETPIIVVDDDELLVSLIKEQAKHFEYRVIPLLSTEDLEAAIEQYRPEAILMDVIFPDSKHSGIEVINQLKAKNKINCPVVFMSNRCDVAVRLDALRAGSDAFIVKPLEILELIRVLDRITQKLSKKKSRILIVDDEPVTVEFYKLALENQGFLCDSTLDAMEIINKAISFKPDAILLDVNMPYCNGFEIAQVLRQDDSFNHIPILFLTSSTTSESEIQAMKSGGDDFLDKNNNLSITVEIIKGHIQRYKELDSMLNRLKRDEVRFRSVTNSSSDAIITIDAKERIIFWNEGAEKIFGYHSLETIGQTLDFIFPKEKKHIFKNMRKFFEQKNSVIENPVIESEVIRKDKTSIDIEATFTEWISGSEKFYTTIIRDVSSRRQMEQVLRNKEASFNAIVTSSGEGIVTIDSQGIMETVNPKAAEIFGYQQQELIGKNVSVLVPKKERKHHDSYVKTSEIHAQRIINQARDLEGLRKDGSLFALELNVSPMLINNQRKFVGILRDVSERKQFINELLTAKAEAESANTAKTQFLSSMSHELRTPLNAILGFTQILQTDTEHPPSLDQLDSLEHIYNAGMHLLALITEVLDLSKIESGALELNLEEVLLIHFINIAVNQLEPLALEAEIKIENTLKNHSEEILVIADEIKLKQVINNLLSNAIKYNKPKGVVKVSLKVFSDKVRVFISDTGKGIQENLLGKLFEPFNRLGQETGTIEGTGIGLTITKKLVEMMNGDIGVESKINEGTTFWIDLPISKQKN